MKYRWFKKESIGWSGRTIAWLQTQPRRRHSGGRLLDVKVFTKTDGNKIWPPVVSNLLAVHGHSYNNYQVYTSKVLL